MDRPSEESVQCSVFGVQIPVYTPYVTRHTFLFLLVALSGGCVSQVFAPAKGYPGKADAAAALDALRQQAKAAVPFRANGQCRIGFVVESGRTRKFNLPVNVWVNPPSEVYMQGLAPGGPQGKVFLGTNEREFWLGIRPDINTFWWGEWSKASIAQDLPFSPRAVFESLGVAASDLGQADPNRWTLSSAAGQDVLTWTDAQGRPAKRLFVERRRYRITRIEYLDQAGHVVVGVEMKRYEQVAEGFSVPSRISIVASAEGQRTQWAVLSLGSFLERTYNEQFRDRYFVRPEPVGFETVIEVDGQ